MMRRASSASSGWTAMRTSPSSLTVSGNTECVHRRTTRRRHAVRLEQPADDARLDVGVRAEDDDEIAHRARPSGARAASPTGRDVRRRRLDLQQDHRHVVVLRRGADERLDLAQHPLAQLVGRQMRVLLDRAAPSRASPKQSSAAFIASVMPSVKNTIQVARRASGNRLLLQQPLEHLAVVDLQARAPGRRREHLRRGSRSAAGAGR